MHPQIATTHTHIAHRARAHARTHTHTHITLASHSHCQHTHIAHTHTHAHTARTTPSHCHNTHSHRARAHTHTIRILTAFFCAATGLMRATELPSPVRLGADCVSASESGCDLRRACCGGRNVPHRVRDLFTRFYIRMYVYACTCTHRGQGPGPRAPPVGYCSLPVWAPPAAARAAGPQARGPLHCSGRETWHRDSGSVGIELARSWKETKPVPAGSTALRVADRAFRC